MIAADIMSTNPITIDANKTVKDAAELMFDKNISILPVFDGDKFVGLITQSDFVGKAVDVPHAVVSMKQLFGQNFNAQSVEEVYKNAQSKPLSEVMSTGIKSVGPNDSIDAVVDAMIKSNLKRLPVVEDGKLVGIITRRNILHAFVKAN